MGLVCTALTLAFYLIVTWVVLSWIVGYGRLPYGHPVAKVYETINRFLQPVLRPLREAVKPVRMGGMALDLSPLILIFGITILRSFVC